jgi:hypothetical protein
MNVPVPEFMNRAQKLWAMAFSPNDHEALLAMRKLSTVLGRNGVHPNDVVLLVPQGNDLMNHLSACMRRYTEAQDTIRDLQKQVSDLQRTVVLMSEREPRRSRQRVAAEEWMPFADFQALAEQVLGPRNKRGWFKKLAEVLGLPRTSLCTYQHRKRIPRRFVEVLRAYKRAA